MLSSVSLRSRVCPALLVLLASSLLSGLGFAQVNDSSTNSAAKPSTDPKEFKAVKYDAALAAELGADELGMKHYVFVLLKTGPTKLTDQAEAQRIFAGHFSNMERLAEAGKLLVAGPFENGAPKRGLFILNIGTLEEAEKLVKTDPAVAAGVFDYELTKLYCSAALMKVGEIHARIQQKKIQ